jgi:hypothetical protein
MAGDWIKVRKSLLTDPKIVRISSALKADRLRTVGAVVSAWCLLDDHTEDGRLDGYTVELFDEVLCCVGLARAMASVDWLEIGDGFLAAPRFGEHNGKSAKRRMNDAVRKMSARQADKCPLGVRLKSGPEKRREEKSILTLTSKNNTARGSLDELKLFAVEIGLPASDGEAMYHHWEANGWRNGQSPSKDWRAGIRKWESQGWLPSQKNGAAKSHRQTGYAEIIELP